MEEKSVTLEVDSLQHLQFVGHVPTLWFTYSFAPDWHADALNEARTGKDHHSIRREIIFSVAFAESYIVEWVRDDILGGDFEKLKEYFTADKKLTPIEKWKLIPKKLCDEGLLKKVPDLKSDFWVKWTKLIDLRNGLIHAVSSLPATSDLDEKQKPLPSLNHLSKIKHGVPLQTAEELVKAFHGKAEIPLPQWFKEQSYTVNLKPSAH